MNNNTSLKIVIAETSVIIRSGLTAVLKRIPNLNAHPIDDIDVITSKINHLLHTEEEEEKDSEQETLSQREKEIITCVVKGMTNKAIADKLYLSIHTVITHRRNIARKLQIHSPAGLTIYAIVNKLVELGDIKDSL